MSHRALRSALWSLVLSGLVIGCKSPNRATAPPSAAASDRDVVARLDLTPERLAGLTEGTMSVETDPFYDEKRPTFGGYAFDEVMALIPGIARIDRERHSLRFVCADGYRTVFPFEAVVGGKGLLATRLANSPHADSPWRTIRRGKTEQTPAPYYLVWADETDLKKRPWPYQLVRIEVITNASLESALAPPAEAKVDAGYELFRTHCLACHSVNLQGGKMGPELNVPQNILAYRDEARLMAFVKSPQSFRAGSLMPPQGLSDAKLKAVFAYLRAMAARKVCATPAACAAHAAKGP